MNTEKLVRKLNQAGETNVGRTERTASMVGGGALMLLSLFKPSKNKIPLMVGSGYLLYRGLTGKDPVYQAAGIVRSRFGSQEGITISHAVTINRSREELYAYWRNFENFPNFMKHLESVQVLDGGRSRWVAKAPLGQQVEWEAEIVDDVPNTRIGWRSLPESTIMNEGMVVFMDALDNIGTEVHVKLVYDAPGGSAGALLARLFGEEPAQQVRDDLRRFKQLMETGIVPTVYGQTSGRPKEVEKERTSLEEERVGVTK